MRPDFPHDADRFDHLAIAHGVVGLSEQFEIRKKSTGPDAEHETAAAHMIELRGFRGNHDRIVVGNADDAGAETRLLVRGSREAMNIIGEGIGSLVAEKCSPSHNSVRPSLSASSDFSVSSASVSVFYRTGGCTGIMKNPAA